MVKIRVHFFAKYIMIYVLTLLISLTLKVRFLQDKTERSVTLKYKNDTDKIFFSNLSIVWPHCCQSYSKITPKNEIKHSVESIFDWNQTLLEYMLTWRAHISHLITRFQLLFHNHLNVLHHLWLSLVFSHASIHDLNCVVPWFLMTPGAWCPRAVCHHDSWQRSDCGFLRYPAESTWSGQGSVSASNYFYRKTIK